MIADTGARELLATASGARVRLQTTAAARATTMLTEMRTTGAAEPGVLEISHLSSERTAALLNEHTIPFTDMTPHRSTQEQAHPEFTREPVEFRAAEAAS